MFFDLFTVEGPFSVKSGQNSCLFLITFTDKCPFSVKSVQNSCLFLTFLPLRALFQWKVVKTLSLFFTAFCRLFLAQFHVISRHFASFSCPICLPNLEAIYISNPYKVPFSDFNRRLIWNGSQIWRGFTYQHGLNAIYPFFARFWPKTTPDWLEKY